MIEAARSFHHALRLDPTLAMAWLGLVRAHLFLEDLPSARAALDSARAVGTTDERTRSRIEIVERQLASRDDPRDATKLDAFRKAIDAALAHDLGNPELWLLRGNASEERGAAGVEQDGGAASIAFYQQALRLSPDHFGAHHYLVHSYESIGMTDSALVHGERYARLVPAISHAQHMWAHDLMRVGRLHDAIRLFERADSIERAYYAAEQIDPSYDWHRPHNLELLAILYLHQGRVRDAERLLREVRALKPLSEGAFIFFQRTLPEFLILRGRAAEAMATTSALAAHPAPPARFVAHLLRGGVRVAQGRTDSARAELAAAERELEGLDPLMTSLFGPQLDGLRGAVALRGGKRTEGVALLRSAVQQSAMFPGPDGWIEGLLRTESLAGFARAAGDWVLAEELAQGLVRHAPTYAGGHYALGLALERRGDRAGARAAFTRAAELWQDADADLPEVREVRRRIGSETAARQPEGAAAARGEWNPAMSGPGPVLR